jgi:hypothetical protein
LVNDNKPKEDESGSSSISQDCLDSGLQGSEPRAEGSARRAPEVILHCDAPPSHSGPVLDEGSLRGQFSSPVLESIPQAAPTVTPAVAPTDQGVASPIRPGDPLASTLERLSDKAMTDQTPSERLESSAPASATPIESPAAISTAILGAITPSSTPISPTLTSPVIREDLLASLSRDRVYLSRELEGEDESGSSSADADDEREWIAVSEL